MFTLSAKRICCSKLFHSEVLQRKRMIFDHIGFRLANSMSEVGGGSEMQERKVRDGT